MTTADKAAYINRRLTTARDQLARAVADRQPGQVGRWKRTVGWWEHRLREHRRLYPEPADQP